MPTRVPPLHMPKIFRVRNKRVTDFQKSSQSTFHACGNTVLGEIWRFYRRFNTHLRFVSVFIVNAKTYIIYDRLFYNSVLYVNTSRQITISTAATARDNYTSRPWITFTFGIKKKKTIRYIILTMSKSQDFVSRIPMLRNNDVKKSTYKCQTFD